MCPNIYSRILTILLETVSGTQWIWCLWVLFTARCYAERGYATVSRPSVRLSVCPFRYVFHTGWNTSKITSRPNSLPQQAPTRADPAMDDLLQRKHPKIRVEWGWGLFLGRKPAIPPIRCEIGLRRTNRKSHTRFRLAPKSMTLDDLATAETQCCGKKIVLRSPPISTDN